MVEAGGALFRDATRAPVTSISARREFDILFYMNALHICVLTL